jgi:hypothetical protein
MEDTRLNQISALADDARCLADDLLDEELLMTQRMLLGYARQHFNEAIKNIQHLKEL